VKSAHDRQKASYSRWVVNVSELTAPGAKFIDMPPGVGRLDFSALPQNGVERLVQKPRISRYRAALEAVVAARGMPIISHLPRMTAAVSTFELLTRTKSPHLAFSFNFTNLPRGVARPYLTRAFRSVDEFFVFSEYERGLYSDYFALPGDRLTRLIWTQDVPVPADEPSPFATDSYVSAIGGEGRDYATLIAAAERLPDIEFVIVARPYNRLSRLPDNVRLLHNVPLGSTWRIAVESACLVVPLRDRTTCCGHITIVSGELLGIPVISTNSEATREYTEDVALCEPSDVEALTRLIRSHFSEAPVLKAQAAARVPAKVAKYDRSHWQAAVQQSLMRYL
jgi:glycosyltransferase involved in cell wall biosynthesis